MNSLPLPASSGWITFPGKPNVPINIGILITYFLTLLKKPLLMPILIGYKRVDHSDLDGSMES
jgi:hypothetical protein